MEAARPFKIVVVEDNPTNRYLMRLHLTNRGHDVIEITDGLKANPAFVEHMPDLIILDIGLPGKSGVDIARDAKKDDRVAHIPILAVSAFFTKDDKDLLVKSGCDMYLPKPFLSAEFMEAVSICLGDFEGGTVDKTSERFWLNN